MQSAVATTTDIYSFLSISSTTQPQAFPRFFSFSTVLRSTQKPNMNSITTQLTSSEEDENHCLFAMQLASASVLPMVLKAAMELNVLEIIARAGPGAHLSPLEIAAHLSTQNPEAPVLLDRILRLLASHSVLTCSLHQTHGDGRVQRLYGLAPACRHFVQNQDGVSLAPLLHLIQDKALIESWYQLKEAVLEGGIPFNKAHGVSAIEYVGKNPKLSQVFRSSMSDYNTLFMKKVLDTYKGFEGLNELVAVGGGSGAILSMIISKYPSVNGVNFDLPHVIKNAPSYPGVKHVAGDMFEYIPKGEAIFMKWILHSLSDENCVKLLKNCHKALLDRGKVIVVDLIIPVAPETSVAAQSIYQFDLFMMNMNPEGKERTMEEFSVLAREAGFAGIRMGCCAYNFSVMEFYK